MNLKSLADHNSIDLYFDILTALVVFLIINMWKNNSICSHRTYSCSAKEGTLTTTGVSGLAANRHVSNFVFYMIVRVAPIEDMHGRKISKFNTGRGSVSTSISPRKILELYKQLAQKDENEDSFGESASQIHHH